MPKDINISIIGDETTITMPTKKYKSKKALYIIGMILFSLFIISIVGTIVTFILGTFGAIGIGKAIDKSIKDNKEHWPRPHIKPNPGSSDYIMY